ncbi:MAG: hypothetical protein AB8C46_05385 [Burkholderiaceae bacterium]
MLKIKSKTTAALLAVAVLSGCAVGGHVMNGPMPTEPGQGAFGALAEIVRTLEQDPDTDWRQVDIDGLRQHLVDMNALILNASVVSSVDGNAVVFQVSGAGTTRRAIKAMVPAHAAELRRSYQWDTITKETADGVALTLNAKDSKQLEMFKGLGFFGVMATGSHHQMHHLHMATGQGHGH